VQFCLEIIPKPFLLKKEKKINQRIKICILMKNILLFNKYILEKMSSF